MGEVWRATDLVLRRPVAVKLLRAEHASSPETLARFRAEARHAGSVAHPGIARVYDYADAVPPHPPYLVMELVDGPSLAGVLGAGPLHAAQTMDVVAQAAAALAAAHRAGLVHRDIKPANLLLAPDGTVKITDFGIAYAAGSAPVTRTGMLVGTPAYLAPERAAGSAATPASDLYSLGVVAYECLAGAPPFRGTPLEVAAAHQHRPLPALPAGVPPGVTALVSQLTAKDPAARPASASDVAARAARERDVLTGRVAGAGPAEGPGARGAGGPGARGAEGPRAGADATPAIPVGPAPRVAATLVEAPLTGPAPAPPTTSPRARWRGSARPGRGWLVVMAVIALVAGLAGWLLAGLSGAAPRGQAPPRPTSGTTAPAHHLVTVRGAALLGLPVTVARERLQRLGLAVRVAWVPSGQQPGTVVSVQPTGPVPAGTKITLTGAYQPHHHGHGRGLGDGNGDGGGNGQGNGNGGD
jgi:serine/threonine-protein kinase